MDMRAIVLLSLMACGGASEPTTHDVTLTVAPPSTVVLPVTVVPDSGGCMQCIGDTLWDICPATPERQPDADSCNLCGGHCDGG